MEVNWDRLDPRLQCVDGLDDIMRFDLQHFCRRMQPPEEPHYRSARQSSMSHLVSGHVMSCQAGNASQPLHVLLCLNSLPVCTWHTHQGFVALHMCELHM